MQNEPDGQDDRRRPTFLLIAAVKTLRRELGKWQVLFPCGHADASCQTLDLSLTKKLKEPFI